MSSVDLTLERAVHFHRAGNLNQAEQLYRQILQIDPHNADALHLLGVIARQQGRIDEAIELMQLALHQRPDYVEAHNNLANTLKEQGRLAEAIAHYRHALKLKPDLYEAHTNLGVVLLDRGELVEAIAHFRHALQLKPDYAKAYNNLGIALKSQGKLDESSAFFREALRLKPDYAKAYNNIGNIQKEEGKFEEAIANYERAVHFMPDLAEAHFNLGVVLQEMWRLEEASNYFRQALRLKPDYVEVYDNLGNALKDQGELDEAIINFKHALYLKPDFTRAHDSILMVLNYLPEADSESLHREAREWNTRHAQSLAKIQHSNSNPPEPDRRLRIGYVSPDFRTHPVAYSLLPLFSNHDHSQVEIICYSEVLRPDIVTERLRSLADSWHNTVGQSDEQVAELIRKDRIDILVDLALHSANNRLLVFARKPAPIQVTWCGYPGTTGLSPIDYRLSDPYLDPPNEEDSCYSEKTIRLPDTFWCYDPICPELPINELPALSNGSITFGCLNNFCKVNEGVLTLWAKVLGAVPHSRMLLLAPTGRARERVLALFEEHRIAQNRVEFVVKQKRKPYFQTYNRIDLCLDPFPYNGHTTSLDAFWMGVPTVTLIGKTVAGRGGWSQLNTLGLTELAAKAPDEYLAIAKMLAADLPRLQELRSILRERLRASPLMDGKWFAGHMEQAFRQMWREWCRVKSGM